MENSKLIISTNNKKGILLQVNKGNLDVSVWKKETPVLTTLSLDSAKELRDFISLNLVDKVTPEEDERKIDFWAARIKDAKNGTGDWSASEETGEK